MNLEDIKYRLKEAEKSLDWIQDVKIVESLCEDIKALLNEQHLYQIYNESLHRDIVSIKNCITKLECKNKELNEKIKEMHDNCEENHIIIEKGPLPNYDFE